MEQRPPAGLADYVQLTATRFGIQRDWARFLEDYPLILGPMFIGPAIEAGRESWGLKENARVLRDRRSDPSVARGWQYPQGRLPSVPLPGEPTKAHPWPGPMSAEPGIGTAASNSGAAARRDTSLDESP